MLTPPPLTPVNPGDPISSDGWNDVLSALGTLFQNANQRRGTVTVEVVDTANNPFLGATVTAQPPSAAPGSARAAAFVGAATDAYQFEEMAPATYVITVEAAGFNAQPPTTIVTVSEAADPPPVSVTLVPVVARSPVPMLLALKLADAVAALAGGPFHPAQVIDSHGVTLTVNPIPKGAEVFPVLGQFPLPGSLEASNTGIFLHVAGVSEVLQRVALPELRGLTLADAKTAIEAAGFKLGKITTLGGGPPPPPQPDQSPMT